jgi:hypothetical protein
MAFKGTSGRLLILHSPKVMEVLRITNCLPLVRLSPTVEAVEKGQAQWNFVTGFGSTAVNELTEFVSSNWQALPHANPLMARVWQQTLRKQSESSWTELEVKFRYGLCMRSWARMYRASPVPPNPACCTHGVVFVFGCVAGYCWQG